MIFCFHDKWTEALQRAPHCDGGKNKNCRRGFALGESKGGPNQQWTAHKRNRVIFGRNRKPAAKDCLSDNEQEEQKEPDFEVFNGNQTESRCHTPEDDQRSYDKIAGGVAQPPCQPDRAVLRPIGETTQGQTAYSEYGTDHRTQHDGDGKFENVLRTVEDSHSVGETIDQPGAADCFKRVAGGDTK